MYLTTKREITQTSLASTEGLAFSQYLDLTSIAGLNGPPASGAPADFMQKGGGPGLRPRWPPSADMLDF